MSGLPHYARGMIIKGFGRGSKQLGIPTANYPKEVVDALPKEINTGIYYGLAKVDDGEVLKMVMSIGLNPYYKNEQKSMETHIMHKFDEDLYEKTLSVIILGYLRPERTFDSLEELITAIHNDIQQADDLLNKIEFQPYYNDNFFKNT